MKVVAAVLAALFTATPAVAEDRPGDFDFYVLALSWSPSWCEAEGDGDERQCAAGRRFAFVLHGLWPQRERGWPSFCRADGEPARAVVGRMLDVMPSPGLVRHQWRKHGACSGLDPETYFSLARRAYGLVRPPPEFAAAAAPVTVSPAAVEAAFRTAHPGLPADGIAVTCDRRRLREVRICLTPGLTFRSCPEVDRDGCRAERVVMPPVR